MNKVFVDVIRQVFDGGEGASVVIGPKSDGLTVCLKTCDDPVSKEWFGEMNIEFSPDVAIAVGEALIAAGKERKEAEQ
jgi:hypothetical protein